MANDAQLALLQRSIAANDEMQEWNQWHTGNPSFPPDLSHADLHDADLRGADLRYANLGGATLVRTHITRKQLRSAIGISKK